MLRSLLTILLFTCFALVSAQPAAEVIPPQELLNTLMDEGQVAGLSAGVMTDGKIVWAGGAGFADQEAKTDFTSTTMGRMASITKPMTAIAIMQLVEAGSLKLDAPVGNYIAAFKEGDKAAITVRHLLHQSSGIRAYKNNKERNNYVHYPTLTAAAGIVMDDKLEFAPGSDFGYTSYGYGILGMLIEAASGMSYEAYLQENIWEPAGMKSTTISQPVNEASIYHRLKPGKIKTAPQTDISDRIPGGGVLSTSEDLLLFGNAVLDGTILSAESLALMTVDSGLKKEGNGYGMGWYLYGDSDTFGSIIGHTGAQLGCSSFLMILPKTNSVIVTHSTTSGANNQIGWVMNGLLGFAKEEWRKGQ